MQIRRYLAALATENLSVFSSGPWKYGNGRESNNILGFSEALDDGSSVFELDNVYERTKAR